MSGLPAPQGRGGRPSLSEAQRQVAIVRYAVVRPHLEASRLRATRSSSVPHSGAISLPFIAASHGLFATQGRGSHSGSLLVPKTVVNDTAGNKSQLSPSAPAESRIVVKVGCSASHYRSGCTRWPKPIDRAHAAAAPGPDRAEQRRRLLARAQQRHGGPVV